MVASESIFLNLKLFAPEATIVGILILLILTDALVPRVRNNYFPLIVTTIGCFFAAIFTSQLSAASSFFFYNSVANDGFTAFFRYLFFLICILCLYLSYGSNEIKKENRLDFTMLLLCVVFGMCLMASATHLLVLYLGIETVSIVSFVMAGFKRYDLKSNEAAFKYLVFGTLSSGIMLYGFSLLYGLTGGLHYRVIGNYFVLHSGQSPISLTIAVLMVYAGLAYKISAFPLHFWTPDVYEGSPTPVATFLSVGPKIAGFAAIMRFFLDVVAFKSSPESWQAVEGIALTSGIAVLSAITMTVGNLSALGQSNVKRMLAYSSIAHVGYILMGLVGLESFGILAILFYLIAYCLMNVGAFWVVAVVRDLKNSEELSAFKGLGWRMPVLGVCMSIFLFSLTGIPMFAGFVGKFLLFGAVVKTPGFLWLAILGVLNSVVSLYYYSKVLKVLWLDSLEEVQRATVPRLSFYHGIALIFLAIPTIFFGLYFTPLLELANRSILMFLS